MFEKLEGVALRGGGPYLKKKLVGVSAQSAKQAFDTRSSIDTIKNFSLS